MYLWNVFRRFVTYIKTILTKDPYGQEDAKADPQAPPESGNSIKEG